MLEDKLLQYADRGFAYLLVLILLWRDREVITKFKETLDGLKLAILELVANSKRQ